MHTVSQAQLEGRTVLVTGAASGIGQACAEELASHGANIGVVDLADPTATVQRLSASGTRAAGRVADVGDRAAVHAALTELAGELGGFDALVTAAGIYGSTTAIEDLDDAEVDAVLRVNFKGTLWCVQAALAAGVTHIVCIGSVAGKVGGVLAGPHYAASKGAVHSLVKWAARAGAPDVLVNGIAPGAVRTPMITGRPYSDDYCPLGRLGEPEDIAKIARVLCSPDASYMTGQVVDVSGGYLL
jgi:3-oxoacyl-[acyl-carrier protein] reductase